MKTAVKASSITDDIIREISFIRPADALERDYINDTLAWMNSGAPLFRIHKPDIPPKHLVSYFVVFDEQERKILLVDHKKAQLWLPTGGHVEENEHPRNTAMRECREELGITARFWREAPLFLTVTETTGLTAGHTDVSLWYVLTGHHRDAYSYDHEEFNGIKWFSFDEVPFRQSDPHMQRFINKLKEFMS